MAGIQTTFQKVGGRLSPTYRKKVLDTNTGEYYTIEARTFLDKEMIDNKLVYFIYDNNQVLFEEAYYYLNHECAALSENTRYQKACALRLLYTFLILEPSLDLYQLDLDALKKFIFFLKEVTGEDNSVRDNKTVNSILSNISPMFDDENKSLRWPAITAKKTELVATVSEGDMTMSFYRERKKNYLREGNSKNQFVPEYISVTDFVKLISIVQKHNDLQGELLMRLMFCNGLRIGECLGLTIEDIQALDDLNNMGFQIVVRNRTTDSKRQCAKTKPKVSDKREYATRTYRQNTDYIPIDRGLYYQLMQYIEQSHQAAMSLKDNKYELSIADSVEPSDFTNHYVFINKKGANLLPKEWDERLRGYFIEAGLHVDDKKKEFGLNHRFRHGFAMFFKSIMQPSKGDSFILDLKRLLRHKKISSTMVYLRDTRQAVVELKTEFIEDLYRRFPELNYGFR